MLTEGQIKFVFSKVMLYLFANPYVSTFHDILSADHPLIASLNQALCKQKVHYTRRYLLAIACAFQHDTPPAASRSSSTQEVRPLRCKSGNVCVGVGKTE